MVFLGDETNTKHVFKEFIQMTKFKYSWILMKILEMVDKS